MKFLQFFLLLILLQNNSYAFQDNDSKKTSSFRVNNSNYVEANNDRSKARKIYNWKVLRVVDGDTLEIENEFLPEELKLFVRIKGVDTPEKSPHSKCLSEALLAKKASDFTKNKMEYAQRKNAKITFSDVKWDKYGGRILARVKIDDNDLGEELINKGLAHKYSGGKKQDWCK